MKRLIRLGCGVGVIHFGFAILLWVVVFAISFWTAVRHGSQISWEVFLHALPALGLFVGFCVAFVSSRSRPRVAGVSLILLLLASASSFCYDMAHDRYQVHVFSSAGGCSHSYITWFWWPYDR